MKKLILATNNAHKISEIRTILQGIEITILTADDFSDFPRVEETEMTLDDNAALKVKAVWLHYHVPCLADDTGLEVEHLHGAPGVLSARFAGPGCSYADNNRKLLGLLEGVPAEKRAARFRTVIAYIDPSGVLHSVDGVLRGSIELAPRGRYGFGYDPIFIVEGTGKALAEFPPEEKNRISHRSHALAKIRPIIVKTIG